MLLDTVKQLMPGFHNGNTHKLNGDSRLLHGPLTDASIEKAIETQVVKFDPPIEAWQVQSMSVDLRLDYEIQIPFVSEECPYIDLRQRFDGNSQTRRVKISKDKPYLLPKGEFVLAYTLEAIKFPASIYAELHGKSRHARAGVSIHMTAPLIQPGSEGKIKLEIFSAMPVALYAEMPIAQLILYTLAVEPNNSYEGFYKQEGIDKSWFK